MDRKSMDRMWSKPHEAARAIKAAEVAPVPGTFSKTLDDSSAKLQELLGQEHFGRGGSVEDGRPRFAFALPWPALISFVR